tara:strand:- start:1548 stop:2300 length:753 start_codon:yes stop_codon:yes gene_type:complete
MKEEIGDAIQKIEDISLQKYGDLEIFSGKFRDKEITKKDLYLSIVWSGWGKVSSARAATRVIAHKYKDAKVDLILFTGVAGSLDKGIEQKDIVVPKLLMQYDVDVSPLFEKFVIPSLNQSYISVNETFHKKVFESLCAAKERGDLGFFGNIYDGLIGTGDQFISEPSSVKKIKKEIPNIKAIEMEGAAVAQVAVQERIPCLIVRVISDNANNDAPSTFEEFIKLYQNHSWLIIEVIINCLYKQLKFIRDN